MDASGNVSIGLAFLAGLVSFLSPCVFSLAPVYVGYLTTRTITPEGVEIENRWSTFLHGVAFVLGFSMVFIALGIFAATAGLFLYNARGVLTKVGGILVIIMGLHTMGVIHIPFLEYDTRRQHVPDPRLGYLSSWMMGVFFSAGWTPCIGPVLGSVMTLALNGNDVGRGVALLGAYSFGMGVPFLAAAAGTGQVSEWLTRFRKYFRYMSIVSGLLLIVIGVLLITDRLGWLAGDTFVAAFQYDLEIWAMNFWNSLTGTH